MNTSATPTYREAQLSDIPQMQVVRNAVTENTLSDPALVPDADYVIFMTQRGKGWVSVVDETVAGFAIVDVQDNNIWALFVHPAAAAKGMGKQLQRLMLNWYFAQTDAPLWLGTAPGTRAERFYTLTGWRPCGLMSNGEMRFEMTKDEWLAQ